MAKAIPAKQRIEEIEEGAKREFVKLIRDPYEIQKCVFDLIKKAEGEILVIFSTANAFSCQWKASILELLKEATSINHVKTRILVPVDRRMTEMIQKLRYTGVDIRENEAPIQNKLTALVVDQELCLTLDLNDDSKETYVEAMGLATYTL